MPLNPPAYQQAGSYTAVLDRNYLVTSLHHKSTSVPTRARNGLMPAPAAYSAPMSSAGWGITVGPYTVIIGNGFATNAGDYKVISTANETVNVAASSPTTNRIDIVGVNVEDAAYSGSSSTSALAVVQGTPSSGTPSAPTVPASFVPLYQGLINANSSTPIWSDVRRRTGLLGGITPVFASQITDTGSYPGETQLLPASGGAPERLRRWHSEGRWKGLEEFTVETGTIVGGGSSQFATAFAFASFTIPDPGYAYRLRIYGIMSFALGTNTAVDVIAKDGAGTSGATITTPFSIDGRATGNFTGGGSSFLPWSFSTSTNNGAMVGARTVSMVVSKWVGGAGDGWIMETSGENKWYADVVPV